MVNLVFTEKEKKKSDKFRIKHWTLCNSKITYEVYNYSGIGWGVTIQCDKCKKCKDITDVSDW